EDYVDLYVTNDKFSEKTSLRDQSFNNNKNKSSRNIVKAISSTQIRQILNVIKQDPELAIKIDCEGAEYEIIEMILGCNLRPKFIQFEFGHALRAFSLTSADIWKKLDGFNYSIYLITKKRLIKVDYSPYIDNLFRCANFIAIPKSELMAWKYYIADHHLRI
ncbi:hypothetical protein EBU91_04100, partial [bacterium]|nr:hypothetical protein [bacterium]